MNFSGATYDEIVRDFDWQIPQRFNIADACCSRWARAEPDRTALLRWSPEGVRSTSYGELENLSNRLASGLQDLEVREGERVGIILPQSLEAAAIHMAIYKCALIAVPLARLFQPEALRYRLKRAGVSVVITDAAGYGKIRSIRDDLPELRHVIVCRGASDGALNFDEVTRRETRQFALAETNAETPALIIFTSGTTGPPKGALHGHKVLLGHIPGVRMHHEFMPQPGDIAWTPADWAWAGGLLNILLPCLMMGVPVVYGGLDRFDAERALTLMEQAKVRNAFIPPTALRMMKQVADIPNRFKLRLRTVGSGGESLGAETFQWARGALGVTINEFYGQTECNLVLGSCAALGVSKAGAMGKPVPGHTVSIIDQSGRECAVGERGQVAVRRPDPVMFLGYWDDPEATAAKFNGDWMTTGDQAQLDEEGYFHFVGRDDDIINVAGYRVGPSEIEDALISHPAVRLAAAVGKPDKVKGELVKAYVVLAEGFEPDPALADEIRQHAKERVAANIYPREVAFIDDIPLTTTGKVIRRELREDAVREALGENGKGG